MGGTYLAGEFYSDGALSHVLEALHQVALLAPAVGRHPVEVGRQVQPPGRRQHPPVGDRQAQGMLQEARLYCKRGSNSILIYV